MDKNQILIDLSDSDRTSDRTEFGKEDFATQSLPQKVFSSIWALEGEVNSAVLARNAQRRGTFLAQVHLASDLRARVVLDARRAVFIPADALEGGLAVRTGSGRR
jgi:hypothetical protein